MYPTNQLWEPIKDVVMLVSRICGEKNCSQLHEHGVLLIHHVITKWAAFNWAYLFSSNIHNIVNKFLDNPDNASPQCHMATLLLAIISSINHLQSCVTFGILPSRLFWCTIRNYGSLSLSQITSTSAKCYWLPSMSSFFSPCPRLSEEALVALGPINDCYV